MTIPAKTKRTLLAAVKGAAKTKTRSDLMFSNMICTAVEQGLPQSVVAEAAGVSQAHVSRTLATRRRENEERKAARRSRRNREGGTV